MTTLNTVFTVQPLGRSQHKFELNIQSYVHTCMFHDHDDLWRDLPNGRINVIKSKIRVDGFEQIPLLQMK